MADAPHDDARVIPTPHGDLLLRRDRDGAISTAWINPLHETTGDGGAGAPDLLDDLADRLAACFAGEVVTFDDVHLPGHPPFHARCWRACASIERGRTINYAALASLAGGSRRAARAAGQAMRRNPLPVIVPCHRVVAEDGSLHGYGGAIAPGDAGHDRKEWLLRLEGGC